LETLLLEFIQEQHVIEIGLRESYEFEIKTKDQKNTFLDSYLEDEFAILFIYLQFV
jgi:hypothetical protein